MVDEQNIEILPELKQIVGALLFASEDPLSLRRIRQVMIDTGNGFSGSFKQYAKASEEQVVGALEQLQEDLEKAKVGLHVIQVGEAWRIQNDVACGPFVRGMIERNQRVRLSRPALETLAIIAYKQPCLRSDIEAVRGVSVDGVLRTLIDMQLVQAVRRSEFPGRPWLFGTTQKFLEHFGISRVEDLPGSAELRQTLEGGEPHREQEMLPGMAQDLQQKEKDEESTDTNVRG